MLEVAVYARDTENLTTDWYHVDWETGEYSFVGSGLRYTVPNVTYRDSYVFKAIDKYGHEKRIAFTAGVQNHLAVEDSETGETYRTVTAPLNSRVELMVAANADELDGITYTWGNIDGGYSNENVYVIPSLTKSVAQFSCWVVDKYGNRAFVNYTINVDNQLTVTINNGEEEIWALPGETVTLTAQIDAADETDLEYRWSVWDMDGNSQSSAAPDWRSDEEGKTIVTGPVERAMQYFIMVHDVYDTLMSARVVVGVENQFSAHAVNDQTNVYVEPGQTAELAVEASAAKMDDMSYRWYRLGNNGTRTDLRTNDSRLVTEEINETTEYVCDVADCYDNRESVTFTVNPDGEHLNAWAVGDSAVYVTPGSPVTLQVAYEGTAASRVSFAWYKYTGPDDWKLLEGETTDTLYIPSASGYQDYCCEVSTVSGLSQRVYFYVYANSYTYSNFEELKALLGQSYSDWSVLRYTGSDDPFVISESVTIPANVSISLEALRIAPEATVVNNGSLDVWREASIEGALINNNYFGSSETLTIDGRVENSGNFNLWGTVTVRGVIHNTAGKNWDAITLHECTMNFLEGSSYTGGGYIHVYNGDAAVTDSLIGLDLTEFKITKEQDGDTPYWKAQNVSGLTKLGTPSELEWGVERMLGPDGEVISRPFPGEAAFKVNEPFLGRFHIAYYDAATNKEVFSTSWTYGTMNSYISVDSFPFDCDRFESGDYYFTIYFEGDGNEYMDGDPATSPVWHYEKPAARLATPTDVKLVGRTGSWTVPEDAEYVGGFEMEIFYSATADEEPHQVGGSWWDSATASFEPGATEMSQIYDECLERNGPGFYSLKVRSLSKDITKFLNSEYSERCEPYDVTTLPSEMKDAFEDISAQADTMSPEEIRAAAQDLDPEMLKIAMATDQDNSEVVAAMEELEQKLGGTEVVVTDAMDNQFNEEAVKIVGAQLNTPENVTEPIKLIVDKPSMQHILPAQYNNALSVQFSMSLDNVESVEQLAVPVKVTLPNSRKHQS